MTATASTNGTGQKPAEVKVPAPTATAKPAVELTKLAATERGLPFRDKKRFLLTGKNMPFTKEPAKMGGKDVQVTWLHPGEVIIHAPMDAKGTTLAIYGKEIKLT